MRRTTWPWRVSTRATAYLNHRTHLASRNIHEQLLKVRIRQPRRIVDALEVSEEILRSARRDTAQPSSWAGATAAAGHGARSRRRPGVLEVPVDSPSRGECSARGGGGGCTAGGRRRGAQDDVGENEKEAECNSSFGKKWTTTFLFHRSVGVLHSLLQDTASKASSCLVLSYSFICGILSAGYIKPSSSMSEDGSGSETSVAGPSTARWRPLPRSTFRAVEYPGPMQSPAQILRVVAQDDVDECFNAPLSESKVLEMRYRPQDRTAVPVRGTRVPTQKVLVKVVRRRRRGDGSGDSSQGVFTADVVGSIPQTVRFRCGLKVTDVSDRSNGRLPVHAGAGGPHRADNAVAAGPGLWVVVCTF